MKSHYQGTPQCNELQQQNITGFESKKCFIAKEQETNKETRNKQTNKTRKKIYVFTLFYITSFCISQECPRLYVTLEKELLEIVSYYICVAIKINIHGFTNRKEQQIMEKNSA